MKSKPQISLRTLMSRKPSLLEAVIILLLVLLLWQQCKVIACCGSILLAASALLAFLINSTKLYITYFVTFLLWLIGLLLPIDVAVVRGKEMSLRWERIYFAHGTRQRIIESATKQGFIENRDYVVRDCPSVPLLEPRWAVVIIVASKQ